MEYVMYGRLLTFLRDHRSQQSYYNYSSDSEALTSRDLTTFAYCVAKGMEFIASKGVRSCVLLTLNFVQVTRFDLLEFFFSCVTDRASRFGRPQRPGRPQQIV